MICHKDALQDQFVFNFVYYYFYESFMALWRSLVGHVTYRANMLIATAAGLRHARIRLRLVCVAQIIAWQTSAGYAKRPKAAFLLTNRMHI